MNLKSEFKMRTLGVLAYSVGLLLYSWIVECTSDTQVFHPGIYFEFHCNVTNPFLQVNDIEHTSERGTDGYVEDLRAMGIEAKDVNSSQNSFIPTVCVNGSSSELTRGPHNITITCQEIQFEHINFQLRVHFINHFTLTLLYQSRPPAPASVHMYNNMLKWSRPLCVNESSSSTYSISVNHTLELNYTIHITSVSNGTTINITVSTTSYDLSRASDLVPCSTYHIQVSANNLEIGLVGERSSPPINHTMPGNCPTSSSVSEDISIVPNSISLEERNTEPSGIPSDNTVIYISVGVVLPTLFIIMTVIACLIVGIIIAKQNTKQNAVTSDGELNIQDFMPKVNLYTESKSNQSSPTNSSSLPTYEQFEQQSVITGEEQAFNGMYSTPVHITGGGLHTTVRPPPWEKEEDKSQQSPKRELNYVDIDLTKPPARVSPPAADTDTLTTYATVTQN